MKFKKTQYSNTFHREMEVIKPNKAEILKLKSMLNEIRNVIEGSNSRSTKKSVYWKAGCLKKHSWRRRIEK